jgi:hypothetical protein
VAGQVRGVGVASGFLVGAGHALNLPFMALLYTGWGNLSTPF